jgi:hypothetical protein
MGRFAEAVADPPKPLAPFPKTAAALDKFATLRFIAASVLP